MQTATLPTLTRGSPRTGKWDRNLRITHSAKDNSEGAAKGSMAGGE